MLVAKVQKIRGFGEANRNRIRKQVENSLIGSSSGLQLAHGLPDFTHGFLVLSPNFFLLLKQRGNHVVRHTIDVLLEQLTDRQACRIMVDLLALAHERGCEAQLAQRLASDLDAGILPDRDALRRHFSPDPQCLPQVVVKLGSLSNYDALLNTPAGGDLA